MKKATLQSVARDVRAIARSVDTLLQPANQPKLKSVPLPKGEIEIGITIHENRPARLILLESQVDGIEPASWADVQAWIKKLGADSPSRIDGLVLMKLVPGKFKTDLPYWTNAQCAGDSAYAWAQWFFSGSQLNWNKVHEVRACPVRRLFI